MYNGNLKLINDHNSDAELGLHTYTLGVNQFADWTNDEWRQKLYMGAQMPRTDTRNEKNTNDNIPDSIDWRDEVSIKRIYKKHIY